MEDNKDSDNPTKRLDKAIRILLELGKEVQDSIYSTTNKRPHWTNCSNRLESCYYKVDDAEGFRDMFKMFHEKYHEEYIKEYIFTIDPDDIDQYTTNDDFFKSNQVYEQSGSVVSIKVLNQNKKGWVKVPIVKGPIIYYDYEDKRTAGINFPIGEIYRTSVEMFEKMEKNEEDDVSTRALPAKILCAFFNVINEACSEGYTGEDIIKENISMLDEIILDVDGNEEDNEKSNGPFGTLRNVFKKFLPTLTGGKNSLLPKEAGKMFKDIMNENNGTLDNIGDLFSEVSSSIEKGASEAKGASNTSSSITTMLDNISTTLKSESVVNKIGDIANKLSDLSGVLAPPTATNLEKAVESTEDNNADDQD